MLGPTVPGDAVRRTRAVVAKSLPVTVTEGETVFCPAALTELAGGSPLSTAAATSTMAASATSDLTERRSEPMARAPALPWRRGTGHGEPTAGVCVPAPRGIRVPASRGIRFPASGGIRR